MSDHDLTDDCGTPIPRGTYLGKLEVAEHVGVKRGTMDSAHARFTGTDPGAVPDWYRPPDARVGERKVGIWKKTTAEKMRLARIAGRNTDAEPEPED